MPNNNLPCTLVSIIAFALLAQGLPALAKEDAVCPDMNMHEQTLNEGEHYLKEYGGSGTSFDRTLPDYNPWSGPYSHLMDKNSEIPLVNDWQPSWTTKDAARLEEQINNLPLKTVFEIESAEISVRALVADARYDTAQKLLQRMLVARIGIKPSNKQEIDDIRSDIRRVAMLQSAAAYVKQKQFAGALSAYSLMIHSIAASREMELAVKLAYLAPLPKLLEKISADRVKVKDLEEEADDLSTGYRKALRDCGRMSERLDATGWRLEKAGMTEMAQKAFKESLAIKTKILGCSDPDTLSAYGDQARLCADKGNFNEAQRIYEQTLAQYRKLPHKGRPYISMLENYGDLLNRMNQTAKADKVYAEARNCYETIKDQ